MLFGFVLALFHNWPLIDLLKLCTFKKVEEVPELI